MKASELRIGNLVNGIYEDENGKNITALCRITGVDENECLGDGYGYMLERMDGDPQEVYEDSRPIQLTEDWLLRFGFEYESNTIGGFERWHIKTSKGRTIKILDKKFSWGIGEYTDYIIYAHQLQNLYFALTGEELTIKP